VTTNKKCKPKIQSKGKGYKLIDSPFYKLSSKKKLSNLLGFSTQKLRELSQTPSYKVFVTINESGKAREIQQPVNDLDALHTRIASLLSRISISLNLHSGTKKRSHITNAKQHSGKQKLLTTDIKSFYPSTTEEMVFRLFHHQFKMPGDIAKLLSEVCCYNKSLPTGSRLSMPLAYWANHQMFEEIKSLTDKHKLSFSVYVDDLTISGDAVNELLLSTVSKIVERHGHELHPDKTRIYGKNETKIVTGVILSGDDFYVRNRQLKNIFEDMEQWKSVKGTPLELPSLKQRLVGRLSAAAQVEPKFRDKARTLLNDTQQ
jgi:hypothetical protein